MEISGTQKQVLTTGPAQPARLDCSGGGLHRCRRLRNQSRPGFQCELPRSGQCRASGQAARRPPAFCQHRLRIRWHQDDALRDRRSRARPAAFTANRKPRRRCSLSEILPRVLHRPDFMAFRRGRKMFPRHDSETGCNPATAGSSGRPARLSNLLDRSGPRHLIQLCRQGASGIVHVTNRGECSWYEFAREIIARAGLDTVVRETTSDKFVRPAERPKYSVLSPESLEKRGIAMPDWQDALTRYLADAATDHVGTDVLICPAERSSANFGRWQKPVELRSTGQMRASVPTRFVMGPPVRLGAQCASSPGVAGPAWRRRRSHGTRRLRSDPGCR